DKTLRVWPVDAAKVDGAVLPGGHNAAVLAVAVSADGKRLLSAGADRQILLWDLNGRKRIGGPLLGHTGAVTGVAVSPDGRHFVSCGHDRTVRVWGTPP